MLPMFQSACCLHIDIKMSMETKHEHSLTIITSTMKLEGQWTSKQLQQFPHLWSGKGQEKDQHQQWTTMTAQNQSLLLLLDKRVVHLPKLYACHLHLRSVSLSKEFHVSVAGDGSNTQHRNEPMLLITTNSDSSWFHTFPPECCVLESTEGLVCICEKLWGCRFHSPKRHFKNFSSHVSESLCAIVVHCLKFFCLKTSAAKLDLY